VTAEAPKENDILIEHTVKPAEDKTAVEPPASFDPPANVKPPAVVGPVATNIIEASMQQEELP
jgi:hypothetical protein